MKFKSCGVSMYLGLYLFGNNSAWSFRMFTAVQARLFLNWSV